MGWPFHPGSTDLVAMVTSTQKLISSRRRRAILYAGDALTAPTVQALKTVASETRAAFRACSDLHSLMTMMETESDAICLVTFETTFPDFISSARLVAHKAPLCEIILLIRAEEQEALRRQLGPAPRLGNHWQLLSPEGPDSSSIIRRTYQKADQRRSTRTTLDRFNTRISLPSEMSDAQQFRQLVISDRFLASILDSAFDAVLMVDLSGIVLAFNPAAVRLFEKPQHQALSYHLRSVTTGAFAADVEAILSSSGREQVLQSSLERDGELRNVEVSATPVLDKNQNQIATSLIIRDVTARLQSEQALRTNEKLAAVGRLASSIAHEINNPLEAVTNLIYLSRQSVEDPKVQGFLDMADQELRRMAHITNQTLRFHKQTSSPRSVTCEDLLESVSSVYSGRTGNSQVALQKRLRAERPVMCFDGEIRQVLNNLVGNALDAMPIGGGKVLLRSRDATNWKTGEQGLTITVADTGTGMSPQTLKKLFDAFYTTKGLGGTGLGLWISKEIVMRHRGTLLVRSTQRPGRSGTIFMMFLPYDTEARL